MRDTTIRLANTHEVEKMSALAMRSKAYWGYSPAFMEACREELAVTVEKIRAEQLTYVVAERDSELLGYYALEKLTADAFELDALFVDPAHIGQGVGRALVEHVKEKASVLGGKTLLIQGDPHAEKFYRAAGAKLIGERPSGSIPGRSLPLFCIELTAKETR